MEMGMVPESKNGGGREGERGRVDAGGFQSEAACKAAGRSATSPCLGGRGTLGGTSTEFYWGKLPSNLGILTPDIAVGEKKDT